MNLLSVCLILLSNWILAECLQCKPGWILHEDVCYHFSHDTEEWTSAEVMCRFLGGHLAEIRTMNENNFVAAEVKRLAKDFWLGGTDVEVEGEWRWLGSGDLLSYNQWHPGQPDNYRDSENCLIFWYQNDDWRDQKCAQSYNYICEIREEETEIIGK